MASVNKVILVGNLGADPEIRYTTNGKPVATLSLATSLKWKDKSNGNIKEKTEWHRVVVFNRLAEIAKDYLKIGSQVYVEGRNETRKWKDKNGVDRYTTEVLANELQILGKKEGGASNKPPVHDENPPHDNFDDYDGEGDL